MILGVWGDDEAVKKTRDAIATWINEFNEASRTRSHRAARFDRIMSLTEKQKERKEKVSAISCEISRASSQLNSLN